MTDFKIIACMQEEKNYALFLEIAKKHYPIISVSNLYKLQQLLEEPYTAAVIFLDATLISQLNETLVSIIQEKEYFLIALYHDAQPAAYRPDFIYDGLTCNNSSRIEAFLKRLTKDATRQVQLYSIKNELSRFYDLGKKLTAEKDVQVLLGLIIDTCIELTTSDAGTIYIVIDEETEEWSTFERHNDKKKLKFVFAKNKSIKVNLNSVISPILNTSISGYSVITGKPLCIEDAYLIPDDVEYKFNTKFDQTTGYKTKSILTIPMKDHQNKVMGVIQLINKKGVNEQIISFSTQDTTTIDALAGVAAVVLENNFLNKKTENLLDDYKITIDEEITRRKQADEEINKLLSAVEHSPNTVIITDVNGTILYVNPKFTELTGFEYKEAIGKTPRILKSGKQSEAFYKKFWETILLGENWYGEFYNKKKDGTLYWESTRISSLKNEEGLIKYFISVREDITEKKHITQKLAQKNIELEEIIKKLHETQAQLIQSEKMAGIGQLAAGVAHEINNPIGFAMSNLETLRKYAFRLKELLLSYRKLNATLTTSSDSDTTHMIQELEAFEKQYKIDFLLEDLTDLFNDTDEGLKRVQDIVSSLRTFACIDQLEAFSSYDLNEGVKSTLIILNNELKNTAIIDVTLGQIPIISAMGNEINQVLLSLIINAAYAIKEKFQEEKGIISIKTYLLDNFIYCEVADNGNGIEEEIKNRIFEPFFTTKPVGTGTGLGLSLAYDIIAKNHNGDLYVESELNVGSKFTIKLPIKDN